MKKYFTTPVGRLRLLAFFEGVSLLILVFIAVPVKYLNNNPALVKSVGPVHGILFLLFVFGTVKMGIEQRWQFRTITWMLLLATFVPFGTFIVDYKMLRHLPEKPRMSSEGGNQ